MAYYAIVTTLENVHKDPNSDNLYLAQCCGENVIVGPNSRSGDKVLYLPQDGKIERWFGDKFTLFRKNEDGTPQGGYIENSGHIRAIKLRGNRSEGVAIPYYRVQEVFPSVDWSVGDKVFEITGKVFCSKYIPKRHFYQTKPRTSLKGKKTQSIVVPEFEMHVDTDQLAYNLDAFHPGDHVNITLKMHGCFVKDTKVRMADGKLKNIQSIKPGDMVLGYDVSTRKIVPTKVLHSFKNAPSNHWNKVKISRNGLSGDKHGYQISTPNHKYWVEEQNRWVEAKDLEVGMKISTLKQSPILTEMQKQIALGSFLGDGTLLTYPHNGAEIQESKKKDHVEYINTLEEITQGWFYKMEEKKSGYGSDIIPGRTTRSNDLYNYMSDCSTFNNHEGKPRLKDGIIEKIEPLGLALWYMGDGSLNHNDNQQDRALLAICRYDTDEDRDIIKRIFEKFDINPVFYLDNRGYWRVRFNLDDANKLFTLISPYIFPVMQYKLPEQYRGKYEKLRDIEKYNPKGYTLYQQEVLENIPLEETHTEYDLETELHNYIVGLSIVHNTSSRHMKTYAELPKGFFRRLFHLPPKTKNVYVCGTRRTVVDESNNGYYGSNEFRLKHHKVLEPYIEDGMEIFGEIVGWYGPNYHDTIMPIADNKKMKDKEFIKQFGAQTVFSYGCEQGESKLYIYRIKDKDHEYTPQEIIDFCEKRGLNYVLTIDDFVFTTIDDLNARIEKYFEDIVDPIGKTHVKEGVVVRIVNRPRFVAYKTKTFAFKVLEGLVKAEAVEADMEEAEEFAM